MPKPLTKIDVRIPFRPGGQLGAEYNHIMNETNCDWVLFLDHDLFLCNPHWYLLCQKAIQQYPSAGMFSCWTNRLGRTMQRDETAPQTDIIHDHRGHARSTFEKYQYGCTEIDKCSGMFLLISKKAWQAVGGFPGVGIFKEDWDFSRRLVQKGLKLYRIDGLYVYHLRERKVGSWIEGVQTTKELRDIRMAGKDARKKGNR